MTELKSGDKAPDFTLPTDGDGDLTLSDYRGQKVVLYFYPKDDTSGCTQESCDFRDNAPDFEKINVQIVGISKDSIARHDKFKAKYGLNFPLVSDESCALCEKYGVWVEKNMYGRKYMGIERSSFLIDEKGQIIKIWRKVKVNGHADDVLQTINKQAEAA